ncbi:Transcriptional regulator [Bosea sp. 62]|uniref:GntR family transcriptional regulator n=1 Tax=unclassified Bosea (in: a-proteobacteria) TaxID=2653178 RepID=UPI001253BAC6|nr:MULTISPECIES: GntR family transcriptional regulator [unclassified Bosea (in: a-proteobacteria)]CAD5290504.1 Transcriptional regulator [Bosea sp. 7B]CAD5300095.1 Transcriptional regulator [Bosea sp. 21B]CAD5300556.1 Transcriptional regulator [Bosea sp. 46]VVT61849.1 Transcriptional regulator [Bosea sp. EC-HK365B]VXB43657.1 Transcriptional regulator [Bosea sp. 125]
MLGLAEALKQKPQTVAEQVAGVLREAIADGSLAAGTVLRQDDLAEQFGFSRMPVRDALRQLEAEGIVSIHPTKGAHVAAMDGVEIAEIYALRELLECEALRLSVPAVTDAKLDEADRVLGQIDAEPDVGRWGALNRAFHLVLYSACGNCRLLGLIEAHHNAADRYVRILLSNLDYRSRSQAEHRELLAACRQRDESRAVHVLRQHLVEGSQTLVAAIEGRARPARR